MQLLQSHKAYPRPTDPNLFAFARGTRFDLVTRPKEGTGKYFVLEIVTASGKNVEVKFEKTADYERSTGDVYHDNSVEKFAETFDITVGLRSLYGVTPLLKVEVMHSDTTVEIARIDVSALAPADFFTTEESVMAYVLRERNAQASPL